MWINSRFESDSIITLIALSISCWENLSLRISNMTPQTRQLGLSGFTEIDNYRSVTPDTTDDSILMFPARCEFIHATSLDHATRLLAEHGDKARVLAGGQSLIPLMKFRLAQPDILIDISGIAPDPIRLTESTATIHALTTHATIEHHEELTRRFDLIADGIPQLADPQVRNLGTIGGGLAHADPSNDWGPMLTAMDATIATVSPDGPREYPVREFFDAPFAPILDHAELIQSISIPVPDQKSGGAYVKATRRHGVYGIATAGAQVTLDADGICTSFGFCCADDVSTYVSPQNCISQLEGTSLHDTDIAEAAEIIKQAANPVGDSRGSAEYKRSLCGELFTRAVTVARERATGATIPDPMNPPRN